MTANPFLLDDDPLQQPGPTLAKLQALQAAKTQAALPASTPLPAPSSNSSIDALINHYSQLYGVNPHIARAQMMAESSGDPHARSNAGAMGLYQLMPATAQELGVSDPFNPDQNIRGGIQYLAQQLKRFGGSYEKALAAFNAGPGAVEKYNGVPPYAETQAYVKKILGNAKDAAGSFLQQLQQPIISPAAAAEVPRGTNPFLQGQVTKPLGDTSNPFLQQVATETAMQNPSTPQWDERPGEVLKEMGTDILGTIAHAAGTAKHLAGDVLGGFNNLEQSLGPQRVISEAIAGQPVHYAPTVQDAPGLTDAGLNNLQSMQQQGRFAMYPQLDALLSHAGIQPEQQVPADLGVHMPLPSAVGTPYMDTLTNAMLRGIASGGLQNTIRRQAYEIGTDPVTWGLGALGRVVGGIGDLAKGVGLTDKVAEAAAPVLNALANNKVVQGTRDWFEANAPTKRTYGGQINSIFDSIENRNNQLADLEGVRHEQLLASNAGDIEAAEHAGITANAKPVLPPAIQAELDRDSWLLGTDRVRQIMQRKFGYVPPPDIANAPALNVLKGYQQGYVPMKEVLSDEAFQELQNAYDSAAGMRDNRPLSFTMRADDPELASSPLMDRLAYRLQQGRNVRAMLNTRQQILDQLGVFPKPPGTAMLKAQMLNLPKPGLDPASDVARDALQRQIDNLEMMQSQYQNGIAGSTLRPEDQLIPVHDPHLGYLDPETLDTSTLSNLTDAQKTQFRNMAVKEANTFMLPPAVAQRLYGIGAPKIPTFPVMRSWADLKRAALFALPIGHEKNIASLQMEGPGGINALVNAMRYSPDEVAARTPELAQMGAMGMGSQHELPQVNILGVKPYETNGLQQAWLNSQGELGDFDTRQRLALHDYLTANDPQYAAMDPLQKGAKINSVLFDYSHPSRMAQLLRNVAGAPFPAWRLGSIALQGRRLADSPGRLALFGKAQAVAQNALNGDPNDSTGYGWRFNTPLEEAMKSGADALTGGMNPLANQWLMTTLGLGGAPYEGDVQDQSSAPGLQKTAEGFAADSLPFATYAEDLLGLSPFNSRAPGWQQALAGIGGASSKNHPNPKLEAIEQIMADNPFIQRPQAQALTRRRRHGPGL